MVSSTTEVSSTFTDLAYDGRNQKYAFTSLGADGELIAAVTGAKIRVLSMYASCDDINELITVYLEDGTTQIGPKFFAGALVTSSGVGSEHSFHMPPFVLTFSPAGWCETSSGTALNAEFSASLTGGKVEFMIVYEEVAAA